MSAPAKIQLFEAKARALATTVVPSTQDGIPTSLLAEFDEFEAAQREMSVLLFQLKKYILLRVPEIKDEDNAGVRVQEAVLGVVNGPKEEKKTEEAAPTKLVYLNARAKTEKEFKDSSLATFMLAVQETDRAQYAKLAIGWQSLTCQLLSVYLAVKNNKAKIDNPRSNEYGHMAM
eukprot:TRINITY_DN5197_c0_g1_i2.p1 TRINITY_DN5197_c0_g1~~TRINITY_DN5197_c0_g1_i2.p1  ORF type:complete len:175 (-),score=46.75 TRINITY_DN5197_c0_g1_i2:37-561(-)